MTLRTKTLDSKINTLKHEMYFLTTPQIYKRLTILSKKSGLSIIQLITILKK